MKRAPSAVLVACSVVIAGCTAPSDEVATFRVEPMTFARHVTAEGTLTAVKSTPVTVSPDATVPMKVAWIADDGALVKKGDVVVRFDATEFENQLLTGREDRANANNRMTKSDAEASATRKNLGRDAQLAQGDLESAMRFQRDDAEIFARYERIESEVDR